MTTYTQPESTTELVAQLEAATELKKKGRATKRVFQIVNSDKKLVSWKFNEWDYGKNNIYLPSNARGLFTLDDTKPQIVVRGYDKFFNIDEVATTRWEWLEEKTQGPYYVTSKENGCIILISGLEDGTIVVCSKHSYGSREDVNKNHAAAGEIALAKQLESHNISLKHFALRLHELNVTAVAEYCDDAFEEHVVEYAGDTAGLYLHGLNQRTPIFQTMPIDQVEKFAEKYGFKTIDYFQESDIYSLRQTLEGYAKTGSYKGKETEGFVIRCKANVEGKGQQDYFFKFKFEEPYLMYRQWREVTRSYIEHRRRSDIKFSKHRFITNKYLDFVIPLLDNDPSIADNFMKGFGIIEIRKKFLKNYGKSGSEILNQELIDELEAVNALDSLKIDDSTKFIFVPIATIGCGKTTTALTITGLFDDTFGLVINDDVPKSKNAANELIKRSLQVLQTKKGVIIDRNNHQYRERQQIFDLVRQWRDDFLPYDTNVQFVCLNFVRDDASSNELWSLTTQRVFERGDNHQSIKAATDDEKIVKGIMSGFINRFQHCEVNKSPDSEFDLVIDLNVDDENSSLKNAKKILQQLQTKYPILIDAIPSDEDLRRSFSTALQFKPTFVKFAKNKSHQKSHKQNTNQPKKLKESKPVYFSLQLEEINTLKKLIRDLLLQSSSPCLLDQLEAQKRVQEEFHVTLAHVIQGKRGTDHEKQIWKDYLSLSKEDKKIAASIRLTSLIWDENALAVLVVDVEFYDKLSGEKLDLKISNRHPHITIGTTSEEIKPVYSNTLAELAATGNPNVSVLNWEHETILRDIPLKTNY